MDKKAMFKLSYGLFVLTTRTDNKDYGCIINTAQQVADSPLTITIAVNKNNYTHDMIKKSGVFNVSILSQNAPFDIFKRFGFASGRDTDKLDGFDDYERGENDVIFITKYANSYLCAKVKSTVDLGSHTLFVAELTDGVVMSSAPSMTYEYYHANVKPKSAESGTKKGYRCRVCGYVHEGEELPEDFICPICKHDASYFDKIQ